MVHTYGFKPSRSTADLQGVLRECIHKATVWGISLFIASQDVRFAFDSMDHGFMLTAHQKRGLHNQFLALMARELCDIQATMQVQGTDPTEKNPFQRGGKQGGVSTPDEFNVYLEAAVEDVVKLWRDRAWGFRLDDTVISHATWADNIFILASSQEQLKTMLGELGQAHYNAHLEWKASSLEVMACGLSPSLGNIVNITIH